jgi:hypothetical protein
MMLQEALALRELAPSLELELEALVLLLSSSWAWLSSS